MNIKKINGLIVPVFTPMDLNGEINYSIIPQYASFLIENGVDGIFVCGSSGEGMLMSLAERKKLIEAWKPYINEHFKMIVHVSATSYLDARDLSIHARANGAYAISVMGPVFLQPQKIDDLISYCKNIASATPDLPFYYYHIPVRTQVNFKMIDFLAKGESQIPNLAGIKFTFSNLMDLLLCIRYKNYKFDILHGSDETFLCGLTLGAKGGIGTTFNFMPQLYLRMWKAFNAGDMQAAVDLQYISTQCIDIISRNGGGIVAGKAIMNLCGIPCGPCRPPLPQISGNEIQKMKEELLQIGFFDYAKEIME